MRHVRWAQAAQLPGKVAESLLRNAGALASEPVTHTKNLG